MRIEPGIGAGEGKPAAGRLPFA